MVEKFTWWTSATKSKNYGKKFSRNLIEDTLSPRKKFSENLTEDTLSPKQETQSTKVPMRWGK